MKILFFSQLLPFPTDNGGKIKTLAILKTLKKLDHQIFLVCFVDKKEHLKYQKKLKNIYWKTKVFYNPVVTKNHKELIVKGFLSLFSLKPFAVYKYYKNEMASYVKEVTERNQFDVIYIDHLHMVQYLDYVKARPLLVYDEHNISSLAAWRNFKIEKNWLEKFAYFLEAIKWRFYEKKYLSYFDKIFTISPKDRLQLIKLRAGCYSRPHPETKRQKDLKIDSKKILFLPLPIKPKPLFKYNAKKANILFVGLMSWKPNEDAFWWFYQKIFPLIKKKVSQAQFLVIGANPSQKILKTAKKDKNLKVLGYVEKIEKFFKKTSVFVVPIRSGSGTRVKILTALSYGMPVVSTSTGVEGIEVGGQKELIIVDDARLFANKVVRLCKNKKLSNKISKEGIRFIKENYNEKLSLRVLSKVGF